MSKVTQVKIPLLNPNEPEALIASLPVENGQFVKQGECLCTLETTKTTADLEADHDGYIAALKFKDGQTVTAGDVLCYLADDSNWKPEKIDISGKEKEQIADFGNLPQGLRITRPALKISAENNLDFALFPIGPLVTEKMVRKMIDRKSIEQSYSSPHTEFDPKALIVFGGGGHGKSLIELIRTLGTYHIVGIVDEGMTPGEGVMGESVLGGADVLSELYDEGVRQAVNAVGGIGNIDVRVNVFKKLSKSGFVCPAVVHPTAFVEPSARLASGVQIFAHAYVGSASEVGFGSIINTGAVISHDNVIGNHVNISPNACLAGEVSVGDGTLVGMGVTINLGVKIGEKSRIGNGATVKSELPENGLVRAGAIWPKEG